MRWEDYSGLSGWAQSNHKGLYKKEPGGQREVYDDGSRGQSDARKGPLDKRADKWPLEAGKGRRMGKWILP